tara:strand:+ start:1449 stop:1847 length:399 start_codon:yes stop_codon:yes gene_type:complete
MNFNKTLKQGALFFLISLGLCTNASAVTGYSVLFPVGLGDLYGEAATVTDSTDWPEVVLIGTQSTLTFPYAPNVIVTPVDQDPNTPIGGISGFAWFIPSIVSGLYTVNTLHGYIDDDATVHTFASSAPWVIF